MRLVAVPLARTRPSVNPISTFVAQRAANAAKVTQESKDPKAVPLSTRLLKKASAFWMDLGRTDQKSTFDWKRRTYVAGERLMDRIEYQEWALKAIDPALGPRLLHENTPESEKSQAKIPLLYPASYLSPQPLLTSLKNLTDHRTPHHYRRFWACVVGMPFTIPFALVPVVPNLPFFYLVYRAWSHWKAYKSSAYLSALISGGRISPVESEELDKIFSSTALAIEDLQKQDKEPEDKPVDSSSDERLLLNNHRIDLLMERLDLPDSVRVDLRRARLQVERSLAEGKLQELEKEAGGAQ